MLPVIIMASKSPIQYSIVDVSLHCEFGRLYIWRSGWVGTVTMTTTMMKDHDDDKKGNGTIEYK